MKFKIFTLGFLLTMLLLSCRNSGEGSNTENSDLDTTVSPPEVDNGISGREREAIIEKLQGTWKEPEYPFGVAQFNDTVVKFIEEGVVEAPQFREYQISTECPIQVNNIRTNKPDDLILVVVETGICEKLQLSNDTLILSGFSVHTGEDYSRVYTKTE